MHLTNQVNPTKEQLAALQNYPPNTPVVMVNIIKYKAKTDAGDETGQEAYARYSQNVLPFLKAVGGEVVYSGNVATTIIGDVEQPPHLILLVKYPAINNFMDMIMNPEYQKVAHDRKIALEYGGLLATRPLF